jgi:hypothetical protein
LRVGLLSAWVAALLLSVLAATALLALPVQLGPFASLGDKCLIAPTFVATLGYASLAGLPTAAVFAWRRWTHLLAASAAGLALSILPATVMAWPYLAVLGAVSAAVFWATLRSCSVAAVGGYSVRPRLSVAVAGVALILTLLCLWVMPACYVRD